VNKGAVEMNFSYTAKDPVVTLPAEARTTRESLQGVKGVDEVWCLRN